MCTLRRNARNNPPVQFREYGVHPALRILGHTSVLVVQELQAVAHVTKNELSLDVSRANRAGLVRSNISQKNVGHVLFTRIHGRKKDRKKEERRGEERSG